MRKSFTAALAAFALFAALPAQAQKLDDRPITMIVPFTPGTGIDILARIVGNELKNRWDQPVVVENKAGASGNIGTQFAARGAPDGHTLLMTVNSYVINAGYFKALPYDPLKSFVPIGEVAIGSFALVVHPSVPAKTTQEFIAYVKANPGKLNYGSPGMVTPHHVAMELFQAATGTQLMHVPYGGSAGAVRDIIGGHVQAMFMPIHVALPLAQSGQIRLLAVGSDRRSALAPDVPTLIEQGIPNFNVDLWYALFAPAGTPPAIVKRYNTVLAEILATPSVQGALAKQGLVVQGGTPEQLAELITTDMKRWAKVLQDAGIKEP